MKKSLKMGFHKNVVPQVFKGKITTWRLRNHRFKKGDLVAFENSQTGKIFGFGKIARSFKTTVGKIDLQDKSHYKTYENRQELIKAFKRHNPKYKVNKNTPVFSYTYEFKKRAGKTIKYNKLIRDRIPEIIKEAGWKPTVKTLNKKEFLSALKKKAIEEANELDRAKNKKDIINEMSDIQELLDVLAEEIKATRTEIKKFQNTKRKKRGGFKKRLFLIKEER